MLSKITLEHSHPKYSKTNSISLQIVSIPTTLLGLLYLLLFCPSMLPDFEPNPKNQAKN